jgi:membrane protein DedA with SNARE-associated domain
MCRIMWQEWQEIAVVYISWAQSHLPLPLFAFWGAFIEEVISPIPASMVQIGAGSLAQSQGYGYLGLIGLGLIGALGNTLGSLWPYFVYRLIGSWIVRKIGRYIGLTPEKVASAREFLQKGARDDVAIFLLRALPFVPIINPSVICGVLGIRWTTYTYATFLGYSVRNCYMLLAGFVGMDSFQTGDYRTLVVLAVVLVISAIITFAVNRKSEPTKEPDQKVDVT